MKIEKVKKLIAIQLYLHDKTEYVIPIKGLKRTLSHELVLKKVHRAIKFDQKAWPKPYIDMDTELKKAKKDFEKNFFMLMNNSVFRKIMENVQKHRILNL